MWIAAAVLSAFFAGITSILAKCGIKKTDSDIATALRTMVVLAAVFAAMTSILAKMGITDIETNLATAIRTGVVLVMAWLIVFIKNKHTQLSRIDKKELIFIFFSGITTGISWLLYYYAIRNGIVSIVVPIDKLSIVVTAAFSYLVFKEKLGKKSFAGLCMMVGGTLIMAVLV